MPAHIRVLPLFVEPGAKMPYPALVLAGIAMPVLDLRRIPARASSGQQR
ncbi:hypothetical protein SAMN05216548_101559 [Faunimonas pinastri]|uniref:Uncharacterized protein n=1 Tax=Faunimonas pinastri TaxID=1855383 RepID=A0A1H9AY10_9HYPH|nr:hypothetical protein [Faunimonas pinastri]SEP81660.1 hypothetical protein SAMN05216548_101559 [Faunimonas pinastri]